jgi:hypothetical protein
LKKVGIRILAVLFFFVFTAPILAQTTGIVQVVDETDVLVYFASIPALASAVLLVTQFIKQFWKLAGSGAQYLSWGVSFALAVVGMQFDFGIFNSIAWWVGLIYALAAGLIANGLFDWSFIRSILKALKLYEGDAIDGAKF